MVDFPGDVEAIVGHLSGHQTMEAYHSELRALGTHYLRLDVVGDPPKIG